VWEEEKQDIDGSSPVPVANAVLTGFQRNLSSLRRLTEHISVRIYLNDIKVSNKKLEFIIGWHKNVFILKMHERNYFNRFVRCYIGTC
jgi:hypothetical protein